MEKLYRRFFEYWLRASCKKAVLKNFRFHDLRHCTISRWATAGIPIEAAMQAAGHKSVASHKKYQKLQRYELRTDFLKKPKRFRLGLGTPAGGCLGVGEVAGHGKNKKDFVVPSRNHRARRILVQSLGLRAFHQMRKRINLFRYDGAPLMGEPSRHSWR